MGSLILSSLLAVLSACERNTDAENIRLSIENLSGQSNDTLSHLVINISGSDMSTIIYTWDRHGSDGTELTAPTSFNFELSTGSGRLIQVLAVYKSSDSKMGFYYGDQTVDLRASQSIAIPVASMAQNATILSGNISGRYLTNANAGPTGNVDIRFAPPGGKPEMTLEKGHIINGWFNLFGLTSVSLRYLVSDGTVLWGGPVNLDSAPFLTSSQQISRVSLPVSKRKEWSGGTYSWMQEEARIYVYGWFGPAVTSQVICRPAVLGYFNNLVNYNAPTVNSSDPSLGYFLTMTASGAVPSLAELTDTASASSFAVVSYGTDSSTCAGLSELTTKISLTKTQFDGMGRDGAAAFIPPFLKQASQTSAFLTSNSSGVHSIAGALLPDIYPGIIDGLKIYKRILNDNWSYPFDTFSCSQSATDKAQFSLVADVYGGAFASGVLAYTPVLASGENAYSGSAVLVCPTKSGQALGSGILMKGNNFY